MYDINRLIELVGEMVDVIYDGGAQTAKELGDFLLPIIQKMMAELGLEGLTKE